MTEESRNFGAVTFKEVHPVQDRSMAGDGMPI
jgi:hypothetical protein